MKSRYRVIRRPVITEKSNLQKEAANQVAFEVDPRASKVEIRQAVESLFKVRVLKVRTAHFAGKKKRLGRSLGKRPDWKKALVTLRPGDKIEFFESV